MSAVSATSAKRNAAVKWIRPPASVSTQATRPRSVCSATRERLAEQSEVIGYEPTAIRYTPPRAAA
jgi:hypothetical protein